MVPIRVLVLEDDKDIIDLIRSVLEPAYECFEAHNGLEGMQQALAGEPDLILCDIMMPVLDGWEFIRRLRALPDFTGVPVIFLSALSSQDQIRDGYKLGASLYLTKPIDPARLRRNVDLFIKDHAIAARPKHKPIGQLAGSKLDVIDAILAEVNPSPSGIPHSAPQAAPPSPSARTESRETSGNPARQPIILPPPPPQSSDRVRILVVDDDRDTCLMLQSGLAGKFEILDANDGITAIERAVRYKPDIFIIDAMLPRMTGYQLTVMLKKNREFYRAPIIFISGKTTQRDQQYAQEKLGVTYFLAKPFTLPQINQLVQQILAQPGFTTHKDRIQFGQIHMEQLQRLDTHRANRQSSQSADQIEKNHLESILKKQLH